MEEWFSALSETTSSVADTAGEAAGTIGTTIGGVGHTIGGVIGAGGDTIGGVVDGTITTAVGGATSLFHDGVAWMVVALLLIVVFFGL